MEHEIGGLPPDHLTLPGIVIPLLARYDERPDRRGWEVALPYLGIYVRAATQAEALASAYQEAGVAFWGIRRDRAFRQHDALTARVAAVLSLMVGLVVGTSLLTIVQLAGLHAYAYTFAAGLDAGGLPVLVTLLLLNRRSFRRARREAARLMTLEGWPHPEG